MGIGGVVGAVGGLGFSVAAPALAGTSFFSSFANGTVVAYSFVGTVTSGAVGYGAGFGSALYSSEGNWSYAHQMGSIMSGVGAQIGSMAGMAAGGWAAYGTKLAQAGAETTTATATVAKENTTVLRSSTNNNFRTNLGRLTGNIPSNAQAHHVFPQKYVTRFQELGINIHDPKFGAWWETTSHLKNAKTYNAAWDAFFQRTPTKAQALDFGKQLMNQYGIPIGF
jgi:hypothetical protein